MLPLFETFSSIQGESTQAGRGCCFLRLAGCNLRCTYCDTVYAQDSKGELKSVAELVDIVRRSKWNLVEITGGEPLIHPETPLLAQSLINEGFEVMIETNGSMPIEFLPPQVRRIMDCKLPGSGMEKFNRYENFNYITPHDEIKFVLSSYEDAQFALQIIEKWKLSEKTDNLLFAPVWGAFSPVELAQWMLDNHAPGRLQLQLHKVIWGADTKK